MAVDPTRLASARDEGKCICGARRRLVRGLCWECRSDRGRVVLHEDRNALQRKVEWLEQQNGRLREDLARARQTIAQQKERLSQLGEEPTPTPLIL